MGCDIHVFVETQAENGEWVTLGEVHRTWDNDKPTGLASSRNYERFAALAGVRDYNNTDKEPKGFPDDAGQTTRYHYGEWEGDEYSWGTETYEFEGDIVASDGDFIQWPE